MTAYQDTRLGNLSRTGPYVQSLGQFNTLAELIAGHAANNYLPGTMAYTVDAGQMISDGTQWLNLGTTIPGEVELKVATYAKARLISGVTTGDILYVLGRTSQSDGGQGLFTWVAGGSTTINDGSQLSAPGGIWQRPDVTINAQWYGIDPTGVTASDVALNLAIQDAIIQKKKLIVPSGRFTLNAPLLLYPTIPSAGRFASIHIEGQGGTGQANGHVAPPGGAYYPNTYFYVTYNNLPGMIVNAGRDVVLREFSISGQNMIDVNGNVVDPYPPQSATTNYVTNGCRDSRYSPYAGICIDPFTCATPPDGGYSGFTYPFDSSLASGTHNLLIENVFIGCFVVGIMNNPGTANANGDVVTYRNCTVTTCRIGYASGQTQARQWLIEEGNIQKCNCGVDSTTYGNLTGPPPQIYNVQLGTLYSIINLSATTGMGMICGCYSESCMSVGRWGSPSSSQTKPLVIQNCSLHMLNVSPGPCPVVLIGGSPVTFVGCEFANALGNLEVWNFVQGGNGVPPFLFEGCTFSGALETHVMPPIGVTRGNTVVNFIDCYIDGSGTGGQSQILSDDLPRLGSNSFSTTYGNSISKFNGTYQSRIVPDTLNRVDYRYIAPGAGSWDASSVTLGGSFSAMTLNATTVTFTKTNASQFFCEKDILLWQMLPQFGATVGSVPALKIPVGGISGNNVTANMLFDPATYDTVANQPGAGTSIDLYVRQWAPTAILTCTTNGTTALTAVSPVNTLLPGDCIIGAGPNAADIPNVFNGVCRVVSNDGAGNAVLSKAATGSHAGVGLRFGYLSPITPVIVTVANLPPGIPGLRYMVSDALGPAFGAAVVGGGAVRAPVFADNTGAWIVG